MSTVGDAKKILRAYARRGWVLIESAGSTKMHHPDIPGSMLRVVLTCGDPRSLRNLDAKVRRLERTSQTTIAGQTEPFHRRTSSPS